MLVLAFFLFSPFSSQGQESGSLFAALTVIAYGEQHFDLATGITILPQGGEIVDQEAGVILKGAFVRYQEEVFVEVEDATLVTPQGEIRAQAVYLDLARHHLSASGEVRFVSPVLAVRADALRVDLAANLIIAEGNVAGDKPDFEAAALVLELAQQQAYLASPYRYRDGPVTLRAEGEGEWLALRWEEAAGELAFEASTEVTAEVAERLSRYSP